MQKIINIVIRDNPDDLAKIFDKGIYLSVNNRQLFITHLLIRWKIRMGGILKVCLNDELLS